MKKTDIVNKIKDMRNISKNDAAEIVDQVIDIIKTGVKEDGEVDLYGFVKFTNAHKEAGTARNPRTGETVNVAEKNVPRAKFSKTFKDFLNE